MNLNAIFHRSALTDCYALDEETAVLNIRTGKDITAVNLIYEAPYAYGISGDIHWIGKILPMKIQWELKHNFIWTAQLKPEYKRLQYCFELFFLLVFNCVGFSNAGESNTGFSDVGRINTGTFCTGSSNSVCVCGCS